MKQPLKGYAFGVTKSTLTADKIKLANPPKGAVGSPQENLDKVFRRGTLDEQFDVTRK